MESKRSSFWQLSVGPDLSSPCHVAENTKCAVWASGALCELSSKQRRGKQGRHGKAKGGRPAAGPLAAAVDERPIGAVVGVVGQEQDCALGGRLCASFCAR